MTLGRHDDIHHDLNVMTSSVWVINISIRELHQHNLFDHIRCGWVLHMHMITAYADDYGICRWLLRMRMITAYADDYLISELSTGRMDPRFGSGRVGSRFCRILAGRVESGQHFGFSSFLLIISWYLNLYESSNTTVGLIDFHQYLLWNNYLINK